jgi:hypothetical protein
MKKEITVRELAAELVARIDTDRGIECCKDEIKDLVKLAAERLPEEKIQVTCKEH